MDAVFATTAAQDDENVDIGHVAVLLVKDSIGDARDLFFGERAYSSIVGHDIVIHRSDALARQAVKELLHPDIGGRSAVAFDDDRAVVCDSDIPADVGQLIHEVGGFYREGFGFVIKRYRLVLEYGQYLGVVGIKLRLADELSAFAVDKSAEPAVADLSAVGTDLHERAENDLYIAVDVERVYLDDADCLVVDAVEFFCVA